jgi:hypothetical protein
MDLIDTHCHLDVEDFEPDREAVIARARAAGVAAIVVPAIHAAGWQGLLALCASVPGLHPALGLHPIYLKQHRSEDVAALERAIDQALALLKRMRIRRLGADEMLQLLGRGFDWVIDAIDSLNSKVALIAEARARALGVPVASSMRAGGRTHPACIRLGNLMDSKVCPLAREVRRRLRRRGLERGVLAVWSDELPAPPLSPQVTGRGRPRAVNGTVSYLPALFGMTLAGAVVHRLLGRAETWGRR